MSDKDLEEFALKQLRILIQHTPEYKSGQVTRALIREKADTAVGLVLSLLAEGQLEGQLPKVDQIANWGEVFFTVRQEEAARLDGDEVDHIPWLEAKRSSLFGRDGFWQHYRELLEPRLPPQALERLHTVTDEVLDSLEDPTRVGQWDRRGLVIGHVQSGKTNNYLGLVAKAADAGYRVIIVIAGVHNILRAQTQTRLDEGVIGRDTRKGVGSTRRAGVGLRPNHPLVLTMTSASEAGDFKKTIADQVGNPFGDLSHPTVFVIKKHVSILENLESWLRDNSNMAPGHERISDVPVLVIDDEADNASIDTADHDAQNSVEETDPTRTNGGIRRILNLFDQSAYVGYTATPYANILIDDEAKQEGYGDDLFPRDFIFALEAPSNYVGARRVFGISNPDNTEQDEQGLPIIDIVRDAQTWLPPTHGSTFEPNKELLPGSLKRAVKTFILTCAARRLRGNSGAHNSMLVHVTRFTEPQNQIASQIEKLVNDFRKDLSYWNKTELWLELEQLWDSAFVPTAKAMSTIKPPPPIHSFSEVREEVIAAASAIQIMTINGTSDDVLNYDEHSTNGLAVIAIGGAKLSRGLTLEGLSVSYYLRTSKMYDTLMQMGRWFGYRDGYLDLCRVHTSPDVIDWFRKISFANEEMLEDFRAMHAAKATPREFGLRVRHSPGMMPTSAVKMRNGTRRSVNFGGTRPEVTSFSVAEANRTAALLHLNNLVVDLGDPNPDRMELGDLTWGGVEPAPIIKYLNGLAADNLYSSATSARPGYLAKYVQRRVDSGGLVDWTVLLKSNSQADASARYPAGGRFEVGLSQRSDNHGGNRYSIKSLIGSVDEAADLSETEKEKARSQSRKRNPTGLYLRGARPTERGLLILYILDPDGTSLVDGSRERASHIPAGPPFAAFCLSLPVDPDNTTVDYYVNSVFENSMVAGSHE